MALAAARPRAPPVDLPGVQCFQPVCSAVCWRTAVRQHPDWRHFPQAADRCSQALRGSTMCRNRAGKVPMTIRGGTPHRYACRWPAPGDPAVARKIAAGEYRSPSRRRPDHPGTCCAFGAIRRWRSRQHRQGQIRLRIERHTTVGVRPSCLPRAAKPNFWLPVSEGSDSCGTSINRRASASSILRLMGH